MRGRSRARAASASIRCCAGIAAQISQHLECVDAPLRRRLGDAGDFGGLRQLQYPSPWPNASRTASAFCAESLKSGSCAGVSLPGAAAGKCCAAAPAIFSPQGFWRPAHAERVYTRISVTDEDISFDRRRRRARLFDADVAIIDTTQHVTAGSRPGRGVSRMNDLRDDFDGVSSAGAGLGTGPPLYGALACALLAVASLAVAQNAAGGASSATEAARAPRDRRCRKSSSPPPAARKPSAKCR